jgi:hypothetical protein
MNYEICSLPLNPVLSQLNPAHIITHCFGIYANVNKLKRPVDKELEVLFVCVCVLLTPSFLYNTSNIKSSFGTRVTLFIKFCMDRQSHSKGFCNLVSVLKVLCCYRLVLSFTFQERLCPIIHVVQTLVMNLLKYVCCCIIE